MKREVRNIRYVTKSGEVKVYKYFYIVDNMGVRRRVTQKGYNEANVTLTTKTGKLTKAGQTFRNKIMNDTEMSLDERRGILEEFDDYVNERTKQGKKLTLSAWHSHMQDTKIRRMIYNYGMTPEDIAEETGISLDQVLDESNWNFEDHTFMNMFEFQFNYEEYNGFKFKRIQ